MTAADVKFSFERTMRPEIRHSSGAYMKKLIKSIEVLGPDRIAVTLNNPDATFVAATTAFGMPVPKDYAERIGDAAFLKAPVAAGPFKFVANNPLEYARYTAFEQHYERVPYIKDLEYRIVPEGATRIAMLLAGEADIVDGVSGARMLQVKDQPNLQLIGAPLTALFWIQLNALGKPGYEGPLKDVRVRRALAISIDRQAIVDRVYFGQARPAQIFFPAAVGTDTSLKPYPYDHDAAKKLLDEAGHGKGLSFTLGVTESSSTPLSPETIQAVQGMWERIGVKTTIVRQEAGTYFLKWQTRNMDCELCGQSQPLSDDSLRFAFTYFTKDGSYYAYADATTERLLATGANEPNQEKRAEIAKELNRYMYNNYLNIPVHHVNTVYGARKGIEWQPITGNPYFFGLEYLKITAPRR
jgi:ABC-type transport system substrate-binding protein